MAPDLLTLFAEPSVALLYFMAVIALSCFAFLVALEQRLRSGSERGAGRYARATFGIILAWLALMGGAVVVIVTQQPADALLPPLDRAANTLVIIFSGWAFLTTDHMNGRAENRPAITPRRHFVNRLMLLGVLMTLLGYGFTAYQWSSQYALSGPIAFNQSLYGLVWVVATAAVCALWLVLLILRARTVADVPLKLIFFSMILAGYIYTIVSIYQGQLLGSDAGALRIAFLAAMPLLPVIVYRFVIGRFGYVMEERAAQATVSTLNNISNNLIDTTVERESVTLLKTIGMMIEREKPEDLPRQIVNAVASVLKADVAALLVVDDQDYADVLAAYDAVQARPIAAMAFKLDEQPTLQEALKARTQRALSQESNLNEMVDLHTRLDIQRIGPVYFQPLTREGEVAGILVVALPYTQRNLRENERRLLESLSPAAARLLMISRAAQRSRTDIQRGAVQAILEGDALPDLSSTAARAEMQSNLELARSQISDLSALVRDLQIELDFERSRIAQLVQDDPEGMSITGKLEQLQSERIRLEAERERLAQALQEAEWTLASNNNPGDVQFFVEQLQAERDDLVAQKEALEQELAALRKAGTASASGMVREMITRMSEDKVRLELERDQLKAQLGEVEAQLTELGIEGGPAGLLTTIVTLTEERSRYKVEAERAAKDREVLRLELQRFQSRIAAEDERDAKIAALEADLRRLAEDREAIARQRDTLRQSSEADNSERAQWEALRTRMVAQLSALQTDLEAAVFERNRITAERNKVSEERAMLLSERDKLAAGLAAAINERDQLRARIDGNRETMQKLGDDGVETLKKMIDDLTEERSELEHEVIRQKEYAQKLRERLEESNRKLENLKRANAAPMNADSLDTMVSMAQELRQPLSAITAYIDLMLSESVGILGDLQRQFLSRVKSNSDRLAVLVDEFVRVVAIDSGQMRLSRENLDISEVIYHALDATRAQFEEKGITLRLDLSEALPHLHADRFALQQVMIELLSNAYRATPTDGDVVLNARFEPHYVLPQSVLRRPAKPADTILISITDFGGGVPVEDQKRIFSRLYSASVPLIQGLGDTSVGLSVARALTEAHHGRIWYESDGGKTSTFHLALPVEADTVPQEAK